MAQQHAQPLDSTVVTRHIASVRGEVIRPGDAGYDAARTVRNGMIDRHPALIIRTADTTDVVGAVRLARELQLPLSVRGGGHSVTGAAMNDGGIVIDLSAMRGVTFDPATHRVHAQGGATWADVDGETQAHGMSVPGGVVSSTGIGGLTLLGGIGHMRRKHGLSIDSLRSVEIVTADGEVRTASADEHADLFWAVRGAGSNFGVVTRFEFEAHPMGPEVFLCGVAYPMTHAGRVLRGWRDFVAEAPDDVSSLALLWSIPDHEAFPAELRRRPVALVAAVHGGTVEQGERATRPLRELGDPVMDLSQPEQFREVQSAFDPFFPVGRRYYWKSTYLDRLDDDAIDVLVERGNDRPSDMSSVTLWHLGGAISRVDPQSTAYYRRDAPFLLTGEATWEDATTDEEQIAWSRETIARARPFAGSGTYLNFPGFGEDHEALLRATYGPNYDRLVEVKNRYDPGNLFHMNLNIRPTEAG